MALADAVAAAKREGGGEHLASMTEYVCPISECDKPRGFKCGDCGHFILDAAEWEAKLLSDAGYAATGEEGGETQ